MPAERMAGETRRSRAHRAGCPSQTPVTRQLEAALSPCLAENLHWSEAGGRSQTDARWHQPVRRPPVQWTSSDPGGTSNNPTISQSYATTQIRFAFHLPRCEIPLSALDPRACRSWVPQLPVLIHRSSAFQLQQPLPDHWPMNASE